MPSYVRIKLKPKEEDRLLTGHPWVYANEVEKPPGIISPGTLVEVVSSKGLPVGRGVANPASKILVRLLTRDFGQDIDETLVKERIQTALKVRDGLLEKNQTNGVRLLFGEADGLPGVIADAFGETVVLACFSAGLKPFIPVISQTLQDQGYKFIFEKSVGEVCKKEGMAEFQGWLTDPGPIPILLTEGKAKFRIQPEQGQKTGFYLDFRETRLRLQQLSRGKKILDAFCYTGAASIQAALGGALEVWGLDSSQAALEEASENARLNGVEGIVRFEKNDSFKALRELRKEGKYFDGILLDPPPLAKSAHDVPAARIAFKRLVSQAVDLLNPGGFLIPASCSHHFSWTILEGVVRDVEEESGRSFKLLDRLTQPPDHPILLSIPETEYIRVLILSEVLY